MSQSAKKELVFNTNYEKIDKRKERGDCLAILRYTCPQLHCFTTLFSKSLNC